MGARAVSSSEPIECVSSDSVDATEAFGQAFASHLGVGDCVVLRGALGAGKTVLTRGIAAGMGVADDVTVCSPTYVIVHEYPGSTPVYHLDLYRIGSPEEFIDLCVEEMLADGVVLIEWPQRAEAELPRRRWEIAIEIVGAETRRLTVSRVGESGV